MGPKNECAESRGRKKEEGPTWEDSSLLRQKPWVFLLCSMAWRCLWEPGCLGYCCFLFGSSLTSLASLPLQETDSSWVSSFPVSCSPWMVFFMFPALPGYRYPGKTPQVIRLALGGHWSLVQVSKFVPCCHQFVEGGSSGGPPSRPSWSQARLHNLVGCFQ